MVYVFGGLIIVSFVKQKNVILSKKRNLFVFLVLSASGIALGTVRMIFPYIPSIANTLEKFMK
ncbi:MAG: hypothetical protein PHC56_00120 [Herbinix sp.]|nr:hypothetical protein [Herbinix sp.]